MIWQVIAESLAVVAKETAMLRVEAAETSQSGITFGYRLKLCWEWNRITSNLFRSAGGRDCVRLRTCTRILTVFFLSVFLHVEGNRIES